ncbi:hypothetical protein Tco_0727570 [Tanacetum coccineum]|uniref:Uncharacterized protein n=1 Tax=Tanacetum coccineum TaxID=301880 RepID=A0ABQ4YIP5_9ASTR
MAKSKDNDKGSKSRSQSMKEQNYNKEQRERPRPHELNDKSNLIDLMKECTDTPYLLDGYNVLRSRIRWRIGCQISRLSQTLHLSSKMHTIVPSQLELDLLFGPLYDEFFNDGTSRVNKSSSLTDNSIQKDTPPSMNIQPPSEPSTPTNVHAEENNDHQAEFTNPFCTPVQENAESSSRNIGNSNVHTFNQPQDSEYRWTKDHPLTQVRGNPSKPVQTRRQLTTDPEM